MLAGYVAENLSGSSWEDLIQKYYFAPLQMDQAEFSYKVNPSFDGCAKCGVKMPNGSWSIAPLRIIANTSAAVAPAGAICASASDMIKYMKFLLTQNASKSLNADLQQLLDVIHETWLPSNSIPYKPQRLSPAMSQLRYLFENVFSTYGLGWLQGVWRSIVKCRTYP